MYLENKTEIFYSKNIEIQFRKMYTHFKKGMVKNMKNWKKIMAGLCAAAMVSSMVVPVWAAEETTEEAADDGDVADVSEAMLGHSSVRRLSGNQRSSRVSSDGAPLK